MAMMRMTAKHMAAFDDRFVQRVVTLMQDSYPVMCRTLKEEGTTQRVKACLHQAKRHRITEQPDQIRYCHVAFQLDSDQLDTDERYPWVANILGWPNDSAQRRLAALEKRARDGATPTK